MTVLDDLPTTSDMPQRLLLISPYAPYRDGIAAYAVQQVKRLRAAGHHVEVLSPDPSAAHHHLDLRDPRELPKLVALAKGFDRLIFHFHPDFYVPQPATYKVRMTRFVALATAIRRCPPSTLVLHEIDERWGTARDLTGRAAKVLMQSFDRIEVHYSAQAEQLERAFGVDPSRIELTAHGEHFSSHSRLDRAQARSRFGITDDAFVFLCIGFVAEHKGFDRAVHALRDLGLTAEAARRVRLDIVGSPSMGNAAAEDYAADLDALVDTTPGATLHQGYVSDAAFDEWLMAADVVLLPYRHIWSSGVVERAALFGRHMIASAVGGLDEQLADLDGACTVADDRALRAAMVDELVAAGIIEKTAPLVDDPWRVAADAPDVTAEVRRRADVRRGYPLAVGTEHTGRGSSGSSPGARSPVDPKALAALRRIGPLARPQPLSARPGVGLFKRTERRVLNWELEPIIGWADELRRATQRALESTETSPPERPADRGPSPHQG